MRLADRVKPLLPGPVREAIRTRLVKLRSTRDYERLYERHAREHPPHSSIGDGDYTQIGRIALSILKHQGLTSSQTLVDFGCGTGRLAVHAIPELAQGKYIGIDISETMLSHARTSTASLPGSTAEVSFYHQVNTDFALANASVDMMCAFSVFTHMEHEDTFNYLAAIRPLMKDTGALVFSCLPIQLVEAQKIFLKQAALTATERWAAVRNVATTRDFTETLAVMAGWRPTDWYDGDQANIPDFSTGELRALGQSTCVLRPA